MNAIFKVKIVSARKLPGKDTPTFCTLRLGDQYFKTSVTKPSTIPNYDAVFDFIIAPALLDASLIIQVWATSFFISKELLGQISFPVYQLLDVDSNLFDSIENKAYWFPLSNPNIQDAIGDVKLKIGFSEPLSNNLKHLFDSFKDKIPQIHAIVVKDDDPFDDLYYENDKIPGNSPKPIESTDSLKSPSNEETALLGLLTIDIIDVTNLIFYGQNRVNAKFDSYLTIAFGNNKTFRTRVVRDSQNPVFNERIFLYVRQADYDENKSIRFVIFDYESVSFVDNLGSSSISVRDLISGCPLKEPKANELIEFESSTMDFNMETKSQKTPFPVLKISFQFSSYRDIRRNFWIHMCSIFDTDSTLNINKLELTTMLDAFGSTLSDESIDLIFISQNKKPKTDSLLFDEFFIGIEMKLQEFKDKSQRLIEESGSLKSASLQVAFQNRSGERIIQVKHCPFCKKNVLNKMDMEIISHMSRCALQDTSKLDNSSIFILADYMPQKWYTKIITRNTKHRNFSSGEHPANILVQDRETGQYKEDRMPIYTRIGIRLLYQYSTSEKLIDKNNILNLLRSINVKQGLRFDDPASKSCITDFITYFNMSLDEVEKPLESFNTFNEFFCRKLKKSARELGSIETNVALSPADSRVICFPDISNVTNFWIKGLQFTLGNLIKDEELANDFDNGSMAIFRLTPQDYHRFHFPVDGTIESINRIPGAYFTLNPEALHSEVDVLTENVRTVTTIISKVFGKVLMICVGAMLVGSIEFTKTAGKCLRFEEHGYFSFGGSTIILIFEPDKIEFDNDLKENSMKEIETILKVGNTIGTAMHS